MTSPQHVIIGLLTCLIHSRIYAQLQYIGEDLVCLLKSRDRKLTITRN